MSGFNFTSSATDGFGVGSGLSGLGNAIFGVRSGTAECGQPPATGFLGISNLLNKKPETSYNDCIKNVEARKEKLGMAQIEAQKELEAMRIQNERIRAERSPIPIKWIVIGVAVLIVLILLFRR